MPKSQKLKLGLVFDDSLDSNDGVAQHVKTLGQWLGAQGHEVIYLVGETKLNKWASGKVYSLAKNQAVYFNGNKVSIPLPANTKRIKRILSEEKFDVLHVMMPFSPFMAQKIINRASKNTAIVGTFHIFPSGFIARIGARFLRLLYGRSLNKFLAVVAVSPPAAEFAHQAFGLNPIIIPNPVNIDKYQRNDPRKQPTDFKTIIFLGRLVKRKGCEHLLRAFALLPANNQLVRLKIAGDGPQRAYLQKLAQKLGIEKRTEFLGFIDETTKPGLLASADIACFPSLYGESFGIVLVEAMAAGSGVVLGGDNPGYRSVLGQQPGLLVDARNSQLFADYLEGFLTDHQAFNKMHVWQASQVHRYDIKTVGPQVLSLYRSAIARLPKNSHNDAHE
jgi:phosphatidyl-myo-inositol alpha-mannosyltransferase